LVIAYAPILFIALLIFIAYNLLLLPFAYAKLLIHKLIMVMVYSKNFRVTRADKFMNFVIFLVIGPILVTLNMIVDIRIFILHLVKQDIFKTKHQTND
jgi:hypothetical protein